MAERFVIVHSLAQAQAAAAAAAELEVPLAIASAPGAAAYLGPGWFREMTAILARDYPQMDIRAVLDCADKPGHVLAALRAGVPRLRFTGRKAVAAKLAEIAAAEGGEILTGRLRALDLLDEADPAAACRRWLAGR